MDPSGLVVEEEELHKTSQPWQTRRLLHSGLSALCLTVTPLKAKSNINVDNCQIGSMLELFFGYDSGYTDLLSTLERRTTPINIQLAFIERRTFHFSSPFTRGGIKNMF